VSCSDFCASTKLQLFEAYCLLSTMKSTFHVSLHMKKCDCEFLFHVVVLVQGNASSIPPV
jgi:hypothetical protein